ncbi:MAG: flagellar hook-associated protein FlgK [Lachnospiraceae bacterium]|jgi:flagellar hook-associated protein 1 FlgK|nr:flagellar hook-associated protein FlgK [Lachnospiraceae bacterium]
MPSQFFGLNISYTGLTAANAGLNTVSNNISNVETEGYSRQSATQEANRALRTFTTYGCAGAGVDTIAIERLHDDFYDAKFWDNTEKLGEENIKAYYMKSMENYFTDDERTSGFNTTFDLMYNALEELAKNSGDSSVKAQFVNYAQSLCDYFNTLSNQLSELQKDINMEIKDTVSEINSIAEQLATLNKQINVIELTGVKANELRDKRILLIDQLSEYVSVEVKETPIIDTKNNYDTGANRYMVTIAGGQVLVDTNDYNTIECVQREVYETVNQSDCVGLYDLKWSTGTTFNLYSTMTGGKLQGLIELRDGNNTEFFNGTVTKVDVPNNEVEVTVSYDYLKDLDKCTLSATGGKISLGTETYYYSDWSYKLDGDVCTYTFKLDNTYGDCTLSNSRMNQEAKVGKSVDYQGIPYYQEQLNEFVRLFAKCFNKILVQPGSVDSYGNPGTILFAGNDPLGNQYDFNDYYTNGPGECYSYDLNTTDDEPYYDSYYLLTAANFAINANIAHDPTKLATRTGLTDGESKADIVEQLLALKTDASKLVSDSGRVGFRGGSSSEFLQALLSDVALNAQRSNSGKTYYTTMSNTIDNQRLSVSGVDSDEEAVSLVRYQNSYNLASKMIQTFTEIYDRLILQTGV